MAKATIGTSRGSFEYDTECPASKKRAHMGAFGMTSKEYESREKKHRDDDDAFAKKYPALVDLVWVDNEMYYLIDGKRVEVADRLKEIKEQMAKSFIEVASETCTVRDCNKNEKGEIILATKTVELSKDNRINILNKQIDGDVKCSLQQ